MRNVILGLLLFIVQLSSLHAAPPKPVFSSKVITKKTPGHAVRIKADLAGARQIFLVVEAAGDNNCDHVIWAEPQLSGPKGAKKLTDLSWKKATSGWKAVQLNRGVAGAPMRIAGNPVAYGIGTHSYSVIGYDLPEGFTHFECLAGLDNGGTDQACGESASVVFHIYTEDPPPEGSQFVDYGSGETFVPVEHFSVPEGFEVSVWATSPLFENPTNIDIDHAGRVWVAEGANYRGKRGRPDGDRIVVLEDVNRDGQADKTHTFVQEAGFIAPLGIAVIDNKVIVSQPPDLIVFTDVDRDLKFNPEVDKREVLLTGFNGKNHDHSLHSVTAGPSGQWYFNFGNMGGDVIDKEGFHLKSGSPYSMKEIAGHKSSDGHVYLGGTAMRVNPDGSGLRPIGHNFRNSYEQTVSSFGDVFQNDNDDPPAARTTWLMEYGNLGFASLDGQRSWGTDKRWGQDTPTAEWRQDDPGSIPAGDVYGGGAPTGIVYYENGALGDKWNGLLLSCEPARNTVFGYLPKPEGAGFKLERFDFLTTNPEKDFAGADFRRGDMGRLNTLFRPSDVAVGPDGAIYVSDWFDARVGGHQTLDNTRSGTIYRVVPKGAKPSAPKHDFTSVAGQIAALKSPAVNVRNIGFVKLQAQGEAVLEPVKALLNDANPYMQARAIWLLAQLGPKGMAEVEKRLTHSDAQMRIVAFRALRLVNHRLLDHAAVLAKDSSSAVRREVALALRDQPFEQVKGILLELAKGYDGQDRWYLEAFGIACAGQEANVYTLLKPTFDSNPSKWTTQQADLAWRLHPPAALADMKARSLAADLPFEQRKQAMVAIGITDSAQAAIAMVEIAKSDVKDSAEEAKRWIDARHKNMWRKYDAPGMLSGKATAKVEYNDHIVPKQFGRVTQLPSVEEILKLKGDANAGKLQFGLCTICHKLGGTGIEFGPNLTGWGKGQPLDVIARGIVDPSSDIAHSFASEDLKTTSGKTIQGFVLAEGDPVVLRVFGGDAIAIDKADIASRTKHKESLMLPASQMGLTAQNVRDLVEYLKLN
jgi:putative membrane-bound dehydrogenase-like protein